MVAAHGGYLEVSMRLLVLPLAFLVQAQARPIDPPRPEQVSMVRRWEFHQLTKGSLGESLVEPPRVQTGGIVNATHDFGALPLNPPRWERPNAEGKVFSDALGRTYWASTSAPHGGPPHPEAVGSVSRLCQYQVFCKDSSDARLTVVVCHALHENIDANGEALLRAERPWTIPVTPPEECHAV